MEIIEKNVYEGSDCEPLLSKLSGISQGFKKTINEWVSSGHIVEITKDQYDNCLKYDFKLNKNKTSQTGQLVIVDVH